MGLFNVRSPVTTCGDRTLVVDLYNGSAICLNICEVIGIFPRLVLDVSVGRVIPSEEIPVTCAADRSVLGNGRQGTRRTPHSKKFWPWYLVCNLYPVSLATL